MFSPLLSLIDKCLVIKRLREEISRYLEKFILKPRWLFDFPGLFASIKDFLGLLICDTRCVKDLEKHQEHRELLSNAGSCHGRRCGNQHHLHVPSPSLPPSPASHHHRHHHRTITGIASSPASSPASHHHQHRIITSIITSIASSPASHHHQHHHQHHQ